MMAGPDHQDGSSSDTEPHRMRISSAGSISAYVKFASSFLEVSLMTLA